MCPHFIILGLGSPFFVQATEFDKLTDREIDELPELPLVIARCAPDTKGKRRVCPSEAASHTHLDFLPHSSPNDSCW